MTFWPPLKPPYCPICTFKRKKSFIQYLKPVVVWSIRLFMIRNFSGNACLMIPFSIEMIFIYYHNIFWLLDFHFAFERAFHFRLQTFLLFSISFSYHFSPIFFILFSKTFNFLQIVFMFNFETLATLLPSHMFLFLPEVSIF